MIFDEDDVLHIWVEFKSDRMSPCESAKNGRIGGHGLNCKIFVNFELIFEIHDENCSLKIFSCLSDNFDIFVIFKILAIFECSNGNFFGMAKNNGDFFS